MNTAAETVGSALGGVMAKVDDWMRQREEIARELRNAADRLMAFESPFKSPVTTPSMVARQVAAANAPIGPTGKRVTPFEGTATSAATQRARRGKRKRGAKRGRKPGTS